MLEPSPSGPLLHPLLAEFARLQDHAASQSSLPALADALARLASEANESGYPQQVAPYNPHLRSVAEPCQSGFPEKAATLWNSLGYSLQMAGDYPAARPYYEQALAIHREVLGEQHPATAASLNNLGYLLSAMGDYPAARPYYEQALAIWREVLGEQHPYTAASLNNLGMLLHAMGDYPAARPYFEQALAILESTLGPDHPHTQIVRRSLAKLPPSS